MSSHGILFFVCLYPNFPHLTRILVIGFGIHPKPAQSHFNLITSTKTLFPKKVTFTSTKDEDFNPSLEVGGTIQPKTTPNLHSVIHSLGTLSVLGTLTGSGDTGINKTTQSFLSER